MNFEFLKKLFENWNFNNNKKNLNFEKIFFAYKTLENIDNIAIVVVVVEKKEMLSNGFFWNVRCFKFKLNNLIIASESIDRWIDQKFFFSKLQVKTIDANEPLVWNPNQNWESGNFDRSSECVCVCVWVSGFCRCIKNELNRDPIMKSNSLATHHHCIVCLCDMVKIERKRECGKIDLIFDRKKLNVNQF